MRLAKSWEIVAAVVTFTSVLGAQTNPPREPVARIGDQPIYDEELLPSITGQLWQLKNQEYDLKIKALESLLNQRTLQAAAKSKGLSNDAFLEQTVDRNVPAPSAAEVEAYYFAQKDRINQPLNEIRPQLERALVQAKRQQARQEYIDQLRKSSGVVVLLHRPKIEVTADPARMRGNPDAPVTIVEFGDFQCPYCRAVQPTLKEVMDKYPGKVRLGFRDFPVRQIHPQAQQAAEAGRCAAEQGKFWEYHDLLYANQAKIDLNSLKEQARTAALDLERFNSCLAGGKFKPQIESDLQSGTGVGVTGTPAFYINGVPLSGAQPAYEFQKIIDSQLKELESKKPAE
jgi:protein-disulfide isomerase